MEFLLGNNVFITFIISCNKLLLKIKSNKIMNICVPIFVIFITFYFLEVSESFLLFLKS
jgi:hypothetical protein